MTDQHIYGLHAVAALINNPQRDIKQIFFNQDRQDQRLLTLLNEIQSKAIPTVALSAAKMASKFPDIVHQGIVAMVTPMPVFQEKDLPQLIKDAPKPPFILILDGVTDPHNLGACLRSADAAGVDCVIIPKDKSASITPVVSKVACGAAESIPVIRVTNLVRTMETLKDLGVWLYGAANEAEKTLYALDAQVPIAIVLGAEGEGLRRLTREHCDGLFRIPMQGSVSSLNVSVATGISLYEIVRQRILSAASI
ncbi:MAG: 23S rRNA (guanosine(2251)-2'-O)-methyltransferase RlmB [Legionellaceae bacterium]|nr:23S rRNA (guanosine(2251)-2'-O)-methyltransferase RlmB [Legionellaceae bacterium]MBP9774238.1 23S rRNA (guanosine(2251)-2'-O)-methyltransferase RlmB [Legionellaceae bacterium]